MPISKAHRVDFFVVIDSDGDSVQHAYFQEEVVARGHFAQCLQARKASGRNTWSVRLQGPGNAPLASAQSSAVMPTVDVLRKGGD